MGRIAAALRGQSDPDHTKHPFQLASGRAERVPLDYEGDGYGSIKFHIGCAAPLAAKRATSFGGLVPRHVHPQRMARRPSQRENRRSNKRQTNKAATKQIMVAFTTLFCYELRASPGTGNALDWLSPTTTIDGEI
jgi:hypothetical protein